MIDRHSGQADFDSDDDDVVTIDPRIEAEEWQEASGVARLGAYAVPVAVAHLALIYVLARAVFGFELPPFLHSDRMIAWLWVNGAALGLGAWLWSKGRAPIAPGKWLRGIRARWAILIWLASSLAFFLLPAVLGDAWNALSDWLGGW